jgi:hypothetical protein
MPGPPGVAARRRKGRHVKPDRPVRPLRRALRAYLAGLGLVAVGAALSEWTGSLLPLAGAGSAALMLTAALVREIATARRRGAAGRRDGGRR